MGSNLDLGQDLKGLKKYLDKCPSDTELILSYFGTADPNYYDIDHQELCSVGSFEKSKHINSLKPSIELLAISVTNLQCLYYSNKNLFNWLKKYKPIEKIGYTIFIYDITNDPYAHAFLGDIYIRNNEIEKAVREAKIVDMLLNNNKLLN